MVAYDMDFDDLNTLKKTIDQLIDKYGPPADLGHRWEKGTTTNNGKDLH